MGRRVVVQLPSAQAVALCESAALALPAVHPAHILSGDLQRATAWFDLLRKLPAARLILDEPDAEDLLAQCDAVFRALDTSRIDSAALAGAVERFRTFRVIVHLACSAAARASGRRA